MRPAAPTVTKTPAGTETMFGTALFRTSLSLYHPSTGNYPKQYRNNGNDYQNMNETAQRIARKQAKGP